MLRITIEENGNLTRFRLQGKLRGDWVRELVQCWTSFRNAGSGKQLSIELSNLTFIDESGRTLLSYMVSQGTRLDGRRNVIASALIEEITLRGMVSGSEVSASLI